MTNEFWSNDFTTSIFEPRCNEPRYEKFLSIPRYKQRTWKIEKGKLGANAINLGQPWGQSEKTAWVTLRPVRENSLGEPWGQSKKTVWVSLEVSQSAFRSVRESSQCQPYGQYYKISLIQTPELSLSAWFQSENIDRENRSWDLMSIRDFSLFQTREISQ